MKKILMAVIVLMMGIIWQAWSINPFKVNKLPMVDSCCPALFVSQWQKAFGGNGTDRCYSIQPTSDGGYILAGASSSSNISFTGNHGGFDYCIVKLDANGKVVWQKNYGGSGDDVAKCIRQTLDGGYIVAGTSTNVDGDLENDGGTPGRWLSGWVLKLDNTGTKLWGKVLQGVWSGRHSGEDHPAPCNINTILETAAGELLVGGDVEFSDWIGNGESSSMIAKIDLNGQVKIAQAATDATINSIVETSTGFVAAGFITGYHQFPNILLTTFKTSLQLQDYFEYGGNLDDRAYSIKKTTDGGFILAGTSSSTDGDFAGSNNHGDADYCLVKLKSTFEIEWTKCFGGSGNDVANAVQQMTDGSFYVAGTSYSSDGQVTDHSSNDSFVQADAWLIHVDNKGKFLSGKTYGGNNTDEANCLEKTFDGGLIIAGTSASSILGSIVSGKDDFWVLKLVTKPNCAAPIISNMLISRDTLCPPNHQMKNISVAYKVSGDCKCDPITRWLTVKSNEPECSVNNGDKSPDWIIEDANHLKLRAERNPHGNGRIYTVTIHAKNRVGITSTYDFKVVVPLNMSASQQNRLSAKENIAANEEDAETLFCEVTPNPSVNYFDVLMQSSSNDPIELTLTDISGRSISKQTTYRNKTIRLGEQLIPGIYILQIKQGIQQKIMRLVKQ